MGRRRQQQRLSPGHRAVRRHALRPVLDHHEQYRHDKASRKAFSFQNHGLTPSSRAQDTITAALYYSFF
jgi:hypothetical protein